MSIDPLRSNRIERTFAIDFNGITIRTTVTRRPAAVRRWIYTTLYRNRYRLHRLVVGLGVQWRPRSDPVPATLQLCVGQRCLIFQLIHSSSIPRALMRFLADQGITFAGVGVHYDCRLLMDRRIRVENAEEIRDLAASMIGRRNAGIANMADEILHIDPYMVREAKDMEVGRSRWDVTVLSHRQIIYATVDAYLSLRLGMRLI